MSIIAVSFSKDFIRAKKLNEEITMLENELTMLSERNTELNELIKYFDSEAYAEKKARMELGMKKPDESVIVIPEEAQVKILDKQALEHKKQAPTILKWWRYFFHKDG